MKPIIFLEYFNTPQGEKIISIRMSFEFPNPNTVNEFILIKWNILKLIKLVIVKTKQKIINKIL